MLGNGEKIKENISKNIAKFRKEANLSQKDLAAQIGVKNLTTVSSWERGISSPDIDTLVRICNTLNVTVSQIYGFDIIDNSTNISSEESLLLKKYRGLDKFGKELVSSVINHELKRANNKVISFPKNTFEEFSDENITTYPMQYASGLPASAGSGTYAMDVAHFEILHLKNEPPKGASFIIQVSGNSMYPVISDGDKIFIKRQESIDIGEIGVFFVDGDIYIKKLGEFELISVNHDYPNIKLTESSEIKCFGKFLDICTEKV